MEKEFYNKTKDLFPSMILRRFFINNETSKIITAMDLGCGACKDTKFLLEKGIDVIAVDIEDISEYIDLENPKLKFVQSRFEDLDFDNVDLINAQNSLSFCNPKNFDEVITKIKNAINEEGYFVGNFFGKNDGWNNRESMTFLSKQEVLEIFKEFKIKYIDEFEEDGRTVLGKEKHWHVISIIGQKND